jgi:hypothetical protein
MTRFISIVFFSFFLLSQVSIASSEFSDVTSIEYMKEKYPNFRDRSKMTSEKYKRYVDEASSDLMRFPEYPQPYFIKGYLLVSYFNFVNRSKIEKGDSIESVLTSEESRQMVLERDRNFKKALLLNDLSSESRSLSAFSLEQIATFIQNPKDAERAKKIILAMTTEEDIRGCPPPGIEDECNPLAASMAEYIGYQYVGIYVGYLYLDDQDSMKRVLSEYYQLVNPDGTISEEESLGLDWYISEFEKEIARHKERAITAPVESQPVDINSVPEAYKEIPIYWANAIAQRGLEKYAQWDLRGIPSPDEAKRSSEPVQQEKEMSPPAENENPFENVTPDQNKVEEVSDQKPFSLSNVPVWVYWVLVFVALFGVYKTRSRKK